MVVAVVVRFPEEHEVRVRQGRQEIALVDETAFADAPNSPDERMVAVERAHPLS